MKRNVFCIAIAVAISLAFIRLQVAPGWAPYVLGQTESQWSAAHPSIGYGMAATFILVVAIFLGITCLVCLAALVRAIPEFWQRRHDQAETTAAQARQKALSESSLQSLAEMREAIDQAIQVMYQEKLENEESTCQCWNKLKDWSVQAYSAHRRGEWEAAIKLAKSTTEKARQFMKVLRAPHRR